MTTAKVSSNIVSSVDGVSNDAGDIDLVAGANVTITPNNTANTITISAATQAGNTLDQAYDQGGAGNGRTITADNGAVNISGSDGLTVNGNVGIGITSPSAGLHLSGTGFPNSFMYLEASEANDAGFRLYENATAKWHIFNNATLDGLQIYNTGAAQQVFFAEQSTGHVGIGTTSPDAELDVSGTDGVIFTGTYGSGSIPAEGEGTRMMWYPAKAAFRAGGVSGVQSTFWDNDSIGIYSFAVGGNTKATGSGSTALGTGTQARGNSSSAIGNSSVAIGASSTAIG